MDELPDSKAWEKLSNKWVSQTFAAHEVRYMMSNGTGKAQNVHYRIAKLH
jgi:hypothetical protein